MIFKSIMKHKWVALFSIVSTFIYAGVQLYQPQIMKRIMTVMSSTTYSRHQMADKVSGYGVELLVVAGIGIIFAIFSTLSAARIAQEIGADVREATYKKINTFSYENVEKFNAGNLVVRMTNDVTQVQNLMMMVFQILMRIPVLLIGAVVLSITTLPRLWWITVLLIVLIVPVHSYLFSICPVYSDRSCYLFACICLMSCIYMMSGSKSPDFAAYGLLSLCCPRGSAAAFSSPGTVCSLPCSGSHPVSSRSPPAACPQKISEPQWHDPSGQDFL